MKIGWTLFEGQIMDGGGWGGEPPTLVVAQELTGQRDHSVTVFLLLQEREVRCVSE